MARRRGTCTRRKRFWSKKLKRYVKRCVAWSGTKKKSTYKRRGKKSTYRRRSKSSTYRRRKSATYRRRKPAGMARKGSTCRRRKLVYSRVYKKKVLRCASFS